VAQSLTAGAQDMGPEDMEPEKALGLITLAWLIGAIVLAGRLIRKGRALATTLAAQFDSDRKAEARLLLSLLASLGVVTLLILIAHHFA